MKKTFFILAFFLTISLSGQELVNSLNYNVPDSIEIERKYKGVNIVVPTHYNRTDSGTYVTVKHVRFDIKEEDLVEHDGKTYFIIPEDEFWKKFKKAK